MIRTRPSLVPIGFIMVIWSILSPLAIAEDRREATPKILQGVGIAEHLDIPLPMALAFRDEDNNEVRLGRFFEQKKPIILTFNYADCPMLCSKQLDGLVKAMQGMPLVVGRDFDVVTISMNPREDHGKWLRAKQRYCSLLGSPHADEGWHFLTGSEESIRSLTDTVGFSYQYDPGIQQYAHTAVLTVITPGGHVSRYLYGVEYNPATLRLTLVEAASGSVGSGTVGSVFDRVILLCYQYDGRTGNYSFAASIIMKVGGAITILCVGFWLVRAWTARPQRPSISEASCP